MTSFSSSSKVVSILACNSACMENSNSVRSAVVGPWLCPYHRVVRSVLERARSSRHEWRVVETHYEYGYSLAVYRNNCLEYTLFKKLFKNDGDYELWDNRSHSFLLLNIDDAWELARRAKADCLRAARQNNFEIRNKSRKLTTAFLSWNVLEV